MDIVDVVKNILPFAKIVKIVEISKQFTLLSILNCVTIGKVA